MQNIFIKKKLINFPDNLIYNTAVDALENLKSKEETKPIEDKSDNKSKATTIFNKLIHETIKKIMSELYDSVYYNNLKFEYVDPAKDVSFYEYIDSKELFNAIKNNQIKFSEVKNKQNEFLKKLNEVKTGKKTIKLKKTINKLLYF